jgi:heme-degrading monooxygenase HmoA
MLSRKEVVRMFARVSIIQGSADGVDESTRMVQERILPAARELDGFAGMLVLSDRSTGRSMGITLWKTEQALKASEEAADRLRSEGTAEAGEEIVGVERYEVTLDERGEPR